MSVCLSTKVRRLLCQSVTDSFLAFTLQTWNCTKNGLKAKKSLRLRLAANIAPALPRLSVKISCYPVVNLFLAVWRQK